jgi:hypothetical protein
MKRNRKVRRFFENATKNKGLTGFHWYLPLSPFYSCFIDKLYRRRRKDNHGVFKTMTVAVFNCKDCHHVFSTVLEHDTNLPKNCYFCGSSNIHRRIRKEVEIE